MNLQALLNLAYWYFFDFRKEFMIKPSGKSKSNFQNRKSKIGNRKSKIENRKSKIGNRKAKIGGRLINSLTKSEIENRKSKIGNRKSKIGNRKSKFFSGSPNQTISIARGGKSMSNYDMLTVQIWGIFSSVPIFVLHMWSGKVDPLSDEPIGRYRRKREKDH